MSRRIEDGEIREGSKLRGERVGIVEVKKMILATEDAQIADEVNDEKKHLFIKRKREGK